MTGDYLKAVFLVAVVGAANPLDGLPQSGSSSEEIPSKHCDHLPVVKLRIDSSDTRFLQDMALRRS
jgi:hypothetical protein